MHEVEGARVKPTVEQIILTERNVAEAVPLDERASGIQQFGIDVGACDRALRADPLTQEATPTETATADSERPKALTTAETIEQRTPGRLPHAGLELEAFKL